MSPFVSKIGNAVAIGFCFQICLGLSTFLGAFGKTVGFLTFVALETCFGFTTGFVFKACFRLAFAAFQSPSDGLTLGFTFFIVLGDVTFIGLEWWLSLGEAL